MLEHSDDHHSVIFSNRDSSEAGSSSAPKKQKTEPNETAAALKSQAIKLEVTESVEDTSKIPSRPDAPDTGNLNGALNIGSLPNDAVKSERSELAKPDLVFLSDDEDEICADGKSVNNFRHGKTVFYKDQCFTKFNILGYNSIIQGYIRSRYI